MATANPDVLAALPEAQRIVEVGLRDGLQAVTSIIPTGAKAELVDLLIGAGVREIEVASFAHPGVLPQLADAEELLKRVGRRDGVRFRALVPNLRGAQRSAGCGLDEVVAVVVADNETSLRNQRRGTREIAAELPEIARTVAAGGSRLIVGVACAFFAPARGPVPDSDTDFVVDRAADAGASGVYLAATTGMEEPREIVRGVRRVRERYPHLAVGVHLHNRNGLAMANALACMLAGVDWIESAIGGLGGDPWFPGDPAVLGNAPTEDLLVLCAGAGVATGIDLRKYRSAARYMAELTGGPARSFLMRGGSRADLATASWETN